MQWQQHARASLPAFEIVAAAGKTPLQLTAQRPPSWPSSWLATGRGSKRGRVVLSDGAVRAPAHQLRLSGIAADMHLSASGLDPAQPNPVSIASIVHEGAPPWFAPLRLTGSVQPKSDEVAAFDLQLAPLGRRPQDARARAA